MITAAPLPYSESALEPWVSAETMRLHYALYEGYIRRISHLGNDLGEALSAAVRNDSVPLIRDVRQAMNHEFLWASMEPSGGVPPSADILDLMEARWGSAGTFCAEFDATARSLFGSGWAWVVVTPRGLEVRLTQGADQPTEPALLVLDMWEHAYVCQYGTYKGDYVDGFLRHHANWGVAQRRLEALR